MNENEKRTQETGISIDNTADEISDAILGVKKTYE